MRKRLKLFVTGLLICPTQAVFGTPAADFEVTVCPGQNGEKGLIFSEIIKPALTV
jgi:hypothetical protein